MKKGWGMRSLIFVLSLFASTVALSAQPVMGTVVREFPGFRLIGDQSCRRYIIETKTPEAANNLAKLSSGDNITATGFLDKGKCTAVIESIDYVGLKKLLGHWYSSEGIMSVRDFNSIRFYPIKLNDFKNNDNYKSAAPIDYRYSVTPTEGKEWILFLSDKRGTSFSTIQFNKETVTVKIYDSETGQITKTLRLAKWGNLKK